jgi:hypothetical protein
LVRFFSLPNRFKPKLWCSSKFQIQSTPSPGNVTRPTNCKQIESNSQHHACTQISSYWGHQRLDRVHDYWIQPEAFPKAITKHRRREIIKQKHDLRDEPTKTVMHHNIWAKNMQIWEMRDRDKEHGREQDRFDSNHLRDERQRIGRGGGWRRWSLSKGAWSRSSTTNK